MHIRYAVNHAEADDLLEEIIRQHPTPKLLTVVSSDQRIRACARRRRATSLGSQQFLHELDRQPHPARSSAASLEARDDSAELSESEVEFWLKEFEKQPKRK
jgi:hypothetical protein